MVLCIRTPKSRPSHLTESPVQSMPARMREYAQDYARELVRELSGEYPRKYASAGMGVFCRDRTVLGPGDRVPSRARICWTRAVSIHLFPSTRHSLGSPRYTSCNLGVTLFAGRPWAMRFLRELPLHVQRRETLARDDEKFNCTQRRELLLHPRRREEKGGDKKLYHIYVHNYNSQGLPWFLKISFGNTCVRGSTTSMTTSIQFSTTVRSFSSSVQLASIISSAVCSCCLSYSSNSLSWRPLLRRIVSVCGISSGTTNTLSTVL